jgi:hypothetical protein
MSGEADKKVGTQTKKQTHSAGLVLFQQSFV